jgi:uncharacterized iron-regulated membrane protein
MAMKVKERTFTTFWAVHGWAAAVSFVVLFAAFFLGAFALFWEDLAPLQDPRLRRAVPASESRVLELVQREVEEQLPRAPARLDIHLPDEDAPFLLVGTPERGSMEGLQWIDPATGERLPLRSDLGHFLYLMHFLFPIPTGGYIAGIAAVVLLLVLVSGLVIQLDKLWQEFIRFRPGLRLRLSASDAHKVLGVTTLPFLLVIAWTGAILCLQSVVGPVFVKTTLAGDMAALEHALSLGGRARPSGVQGDAPDVRALLARAKETLPGATPTQLIFRNLGDRDAVVDIRGEERRGLLDRTTVQLSAHDARVLFARGPGGNSHYSRVTESLAGLHFGNFAGADLRVAYAILSLLGALGIVTGNVIWLERRRKRGLFTFDVLLARLTSGGCAGLTFAVAALFVANQVLPDHLLARPAWEHRAFYVAWGAAAIYGLARRSASLSARHLLLAAGTLLGLVPILDGLQNRRLPFDPRAPMSLLGADVGLLCTGLLLVAASLVIARLTTDGRKSEPAQIRVCADLRASLVETTPVPTGSEP